MEVGKLDMIGQLVGKRGEGSLFYAFPGATEAEVVAGALVPEEAREEGECPASLRCSVPLSPPQEGPGADSWHPLL